jgi:superfamily II DNA or RNA helicase
MTGVELRPYQTDGLAAIEAAWAAGKARVLFVLPTGGGKTIIFAEAIRREVDAGRRVLVLAHRREIIAQTVAKVQAAGVTPGVLMAGEPHRPLFDVQVASVATLHRRAVRSTTIPPPPADLVIIDEAHHAPANTYRTLLELYPDARVLGLTATPCRGDGRGLGGLFDVMVQGPQVRELVAQGWLVASRVYAPATPVNLKGVRTSGGDYAPADLERRMDRPKLVGDIVDQWLRHAEQRRTIVFASGVGHSVHIRDRFRAAGVLCEHVDGSTPKDERDGALAQLAAGTISVITNCMVLCEGWDCPPAACGVLARPTKQLGLYRQMLGRVLRPWPGKADAIIIDHAGAVHRHGFPDDPIAWALEPDDRAGVNAAHDARLAAHGQRGIVECSMCSNLRVAGQACTWCGFMPPPRPQVFDTLPGELGEVDRKTRAVTPHEEPCEERMRCLGEFAAYARERGFKPGFAAAKFKERYGSWPPWGTAPPAVDEIRPSTRNWLLSRAIAYAKAQAGRQP